MIHRRDLLIGSAASLTAAVTGSPAVQAEESSADSKASPPIAVFAKPLQALPPRELGKRLKSIGVDGIEATLRVGGQVEPEDFPTKLPPLCDALAESDQRVVIAATDINAVDVETERQLNLLAAQRIEFVRTKYYRYDFARPILPQLDDMAKQAEQLASLCRSLGVTALYQNHAGQGYVGSALWDLQRVLAEIDPQHFGVAVDIRHATVELSTSWRAGYLAIRPHMRALYIKDFIWHEGKPLNVPLGEGYVRPMFQQILADGLIGPLSVHMEHLDHRDASLVDQRWLRVVRDVDTLRSWLGA
ncbi:MAG: TIM barrel protein [Planctomycetales bacterium]|nr:TIM barrel protein [Planctomycetales bacterium]